MWFGAGAKSFLLLRKRKLPPEVVFTDHNSKTHIHYLSLQCQLEEAVIACSTWFPIGGRAEPDSLKFKAPFSHPPTSLLLFREMHFSVNPPQTTFLLGFYQKSYSVFLSIKMRLIFLTHPHPPRFPLVALE